VIVLNELGHVWLAQGELPRALAAYQRALTYGTRTLDAAHSHVAEAWLGLGQVLRAHGMLDAAARHVARAVRTYEQAVGTRHPRVGLALVVLGEIDHARGDRESAREHLELAVDNLAQAEVPPAELAAARFALARVLWSSTAEQQAAIALAEQALVTFASLGEPTRERATEAEIWLAARESR
jgi:tetratricopeptide (TPR) repeat protein